MKKSFALAAVIFLTAIPARGACQDYDPAEQRSASRSPAQAGNTSARQRIKNDAREVGRGIKKTAKQVRHGIKRGVKNGAREVKQGVKDAFR